MRNNRGFAFYIQVTGGQITGAKPNEAAGAAADRPFLDASG